MIILSNYKLVPESAETLRCQII